MKFEESSKNLKNLPIPPVLSIPLPPDLPEPLLLSCDLLPLLRLLNDLEEPKELFLLSEAWSFNEKVFFRPKIEVNDLVLLLGDSSIDR